MTAMLFPINKNNMQFHNFRRNGLCIISLNQDEKRNVGGRKNDPRTYRFKYQLNEISQIGEDHDEKKSN
jgi:hypothetical protein